MTHGGTASHPPSSRGEHRGGPAPATASVPKRKEEQLAVPARSEEVLAGKLSPRYLQL